MFDWFFKVFHALHPPKDGDDAYPWRVSVFFWLLLLIVVTTVGTLANTGGLTRLGVHAVARADEVDSKIKAAIKPLQEKVDSTERTSKAILRALYLPQIRTKVRQRCDTDDPRERSAINIELDRIKAEYYNLSGEAFGPEPTCNEV